MRTTLSLLIPTYLLLVGCNLFQPQQTLDIQKQAEEAASQLENSQKNPLTSLKDALLADQPMRCVYTDNQNQVITLVSGQKMRTEGVNLGENNAKGWMISDGTWMYMWTEGETTGIKYNIEAAKAKQTTEESTTDFENPEEWADQVDTNHQVSCTPATANDSDFTPPANIEFQDLNQMFQGMQQEMDSEELQRMMEQIGQ